MARLNAKTPQPAPQSGFHALGETATPESNEFLHPALQLRLRPFPPQGHDPQRRAGSLAGYTYEWKMVINNLSSTAGVQEGVRPAPMGDRGLGQFIYDT